MLDICLNHNYVGFGFRKCGDGKCATEEAKRKKLSSEATLDVTFVFWL